MIAPNLDDVWNSAAVFSLITVKYSTHGTSLEFMLSSLCSPSHILIAASESSFATRGSLYLEAISKIIPKTKSAVKIDVLFPYLL